MKKYLVYSLSVCLSLAGCTEDVLDQSPESSISPKSFFKTESDLKIYTNSFYAAAYPGTSVFSGDSQSDNVEPASISDLIAGKTTVPGSASAAGWTWGELRNINYFLENYANAAVDEVTKAKYAGLARFFRAWFYFDKLKRFGDVPWYSHSLQTDNPDLYKARDPRTLVADSVLADLDFAIAHLDQSRNVSRATKWTALALKSRFCLFEGTYRKYHDELGLQPEARKFLEACVDASRQLMAGPFKLYTTGKPEADYGNLFTLESANTDEVILAEVYDASMTKTHNANGMFTTATLGTPGLTKSLIDSYLTADGKPFSSVPGYKTIGFPQELSGRDLRLAQLIRTPGYKRTGTTAELIPDFANALTGYQCIKYVTGTNQDAFNSNTNDLPVFRYAEILLNYAEATAELGQFTQSDADASVNLIRKRAGMPDLKLAGLTADPDQAALYRHVSDPLLLEIRRERRVELAMEGFRYYDVMRWKEGQLFTEVFRGMYFPRKGLFDLNGDGKNDFAVVDERPQTPEAGIQYFALGGDRKLSEGNAGNILVHPFQVKVFTEPKHYLYPLPTAELVLNPQLKQNTGWDNN